eukprot:221659_1
MTPPIGTDQHLIIPNMIYTITTTFEKFNASSWWSFYMLMIICITFKLNGALLIKFIFMVIDGIFTANPMNLNMIYGLYNDILPVKYYYGCYIMHCVWLFYIKNITKKRIENSGKNININKNYQYITRLNVYFQSISSISLLLLKLVKENGYFHLQCQSVEFLVIKSRNKCLIVKNSTQCNPTCSIITFHSTNNIKF